MKFLLPVLLSFMTVSAFADSAKGIILRARFADVSFSVSEQQMKASAERAGDYLTEQLNPAGGLSFDLGPVVTLSGERSVYSSNSSDKRDTRIGEAVREACLLSDSAVDFSAYAYLAVMFAGESESDGGGPECVWPQQNLISAYTGTVTLDGRLLDSFIDFTETGNAGIICHEFLHLLGLSDMYDTDGEWSGGLSNGLWGCTSVMDRGMSNGSGQTPPNLNAIELEALGLGECKPLEIGAYMLGPIGATGRFYRYDTDVDGEYFLFECRNREGWDEHIGGSGLLIYHIDHSSNNAWYSDWFRRNLTGAERWQYNQVNCRPDHQCARIVEASPVANSVSAIFFPKEDGQSFSSDTDPGWRYWNGETSDLALTDIRRQVDGSVAFNVIRPISMVSIDVFQDAAVLRWKTDASLSGCNCEIAWTGKTGSRTVKVQSSGAYYAYTIEGLEPGTEHKAVIRATSLSGESFSISPVFTTKKRLPEVLPYIWLNGAKRNDDGSFVKGSEIFLRVYNTSDVAEVRWYLNGSAIMVAPDCRYRLDTDGELKAVVYYLSGGTDIIVKKITVR